MSRTVDERFPPTPNVTAELFATQEYPLTKIGVPREKAHSHCCGPSARVSFGMEDDVKSKMQAVGDRIKKRRLELGWTQDVLAEKAGISKSFLSDLENGKRSVGADKLLDIGRVLSLSLDFLMSGQEPESEPAEVQIPSSLASFAAKAGLSFRQALTLLEMQQQIVAHRSATKKDGIDKVDWQKFYEAVKEFLE
jgi:transcriptional regulator with XRE-family HTH domain